MTDHTVSPAASSGRGLAWLPSRSYGLKLLLVCALALAMTIPALFVYGITSDRENRARAVDAEISGLRGGPQTLSGPMLIAPFDRERVGEDGVRWAAKDEGYYVVHAEEGAASAALASEVLHRSIYDVPVYEADVRYSATFDLERARADAGDRRVDWSRARVVLAASDLRGARTEATVSLDNGATLEAEPVSEFAVATGYLQAIAAPATDLSGASSLAVVAHVRFSGSQRFALLPFAKSTAVTLEADWPHPSFEGGFLPTTRDIGDAGFSAAWNVPFLARGASASGEASAAGLQPLVGRDLAVRFVQPTDVYSSVNRALKYALMFVGFVFLAFFLFEVASAARVHAAQYVLIGLAQAIFYLLLLAFAEHVGFTIAFVIAAALVIAATSLYAGTAFGERGYAWRAAGVFTFVYGLLYVLMRLEDFALLVGALASFAAVAATMYMTRRVDWYGGARAAEA